MRQVLYPLFLFLFLSSIAFSQKTIKKLNKLSMGDSIAPFKEIVGKELLKHQNVWPESISVDMVLASAGTRDPGLMNDLEYYNPEVLFFYKKKKKFTGIYKKYENRSLRTIISFKNGKLDGIWYDSISDGEEISVVKGLYDNGLRQGRWMLNYMLIPFEYIKDYTNEKEKREVTLKHYNYDNAYERLYNKGELVKDK